MFASRPKDSKQGKTQSDKGFENNKKYTVIQELSTNYRKQRKKIKIIKTKQNKKESSVKNR